MSSPSTVTVPEGMSCVNAFRALWENSKPASFFLMNPILESPAADKVSTAEKVAKLFKTHTYFDYEGGRMLKTNFSEFPKLEVRLYDRDFGSGAAKKAIEAYNLKPSEERFDKYDSYKFGDLVKKV
jgi:hypothetical protein